VLHILSSHEYLTTLRKKDILFSQRLNDWKSRHVYLFRIARIEITYGNFTNRGQLYMPRAAIRGCAMGFWGWSLSAGSVFGCGERLHPRTHSSCDLCACTCLCTCRGIRGGGCLWDGCVGAITGWNTMLRAFIARLCQHYAYCSQCQRKVIALIRNSLTGNYFSFQKREGNFFFIEKFTSFLILRTSILTAAFRMKQEQRFFF